MRNPYYDYSAVRDPNMFFGREEEIQQLYEASEKRQSISIVGSRRSGKSSIFSYMSLNEVQRRFGQHLQNCLFIIVDLHEYLDKTLDTFFDSVCKQIFLAAQHIPGIKPPTKKGDDQFRELLEDLRNAGFHPVLLLDAFDKIMANVQFDPNFFAFMRAQATRGSVSYITASIKPLYEVCHPKIINSPFFDIFRNLTLGPLTYEEAQKLIVVPSTGAGCSFTDEEIAWILEQAGRHPFLLQVTCGTLFEEKCKPNNGTIDFEKLRERIYTEQIPIFDVIWDDLTSEQQKELKNEARLHVGSVRKIPELSESWLFRKRLREKFQVGFPDITVKDVKDALENLEDSAFLQNCKLSETHYVFMRDKDTGGANSRGWQVHEFLKVAFERMRPGSIRSDGALEWRLYNILYYHYFKYHLPNEKAAARLGISSRRQFYREQERAILALLKELFELENTSLNHGNTL